MRPSCLPPRGLRAALLATTLLALPLAAEAQPVTGLYIGAGVGANWVGETNLSQSGSLTTALRQAGYAAPGGKASFDTGVVALGSLGWGFGNGLRTEIEFDYRYNNLNQVTGFGSLGGSGRLRPAGGDQQSYGVMFNALYDFHIAGSPWVVPYVGAGVGIAWTQWNGSRAVWNSFTPNIPPGSVAAAQSTINSTEMNFAYQAMIGAAFPIAGVPGLSLTTEFRYFGTLQNKFTASTALVDPRGTVVRSASGSVEASNNNYAVLVGMRYAFNAAPPPVPVAAPPPPPPAARTYLVFFDWDRADLTTRAKEIIAEAADNSRRVQVTRIEVAGHADRSGTPAYNQRLSQRRADNVAAELVRRGVPQGIISVTAYGESRPLVPTADGVREPQNRRVEIVLR